MRKIVFIAAAAAVAVTASACSSSVSGGSGNSGGSGATVASKLVLGGPPEFRTRVDGIPGLAKVYGVTFGSFKALDAGGPLTINALKNGQVDAADIFTTDPSIKADDFVVLKDPKNLYTAQNVLPLISKSKATSGVTQVLDALSAKLTTTDLVSLNEKVITEKLSSTSVAADFVKGLDLPASTAAKGQSLIIGSANFPENVTLAYIYADALQAAGATVSVKPNIGSRETYIPALEDGSINLIPEYSGVLLQYFDKTATAETSADVFTALQKAVPSGLTVLTQSDAQDKDAIVVTAATAKKYDLSSIADLAKKS